MNILFTIAAFIVALGILIAVHEFGHFWVARRVGVKVLRFSLGFGHPLLRYQRTPSDTEYVISAIPLGGYVKMLDEREGEVPEDQVHLAFNRQVLWRRVAIVAAGPIFNLIFAVLAYWLVILGGELGPKPVVAEVAPHSIAADAGFRPGDRLLRVGDRESPTWEAAVFAFAAQAMDGDDLVVRVRAEDGLERDRLIPGTRLAGLEESPNLIDRLGLGPRQRPAVIGGLIAGEPAERAGFQAGDRIVSVDGTAIEGWRDWVERIQRSPGQRLVVGVQRGERHLDLIVTPRIKDSDGRRIGLIGAKSQSDEELIGSYLVEVRYGPLAALGQAAYKTADMAGLMLKVIGRMLVGQASIKNLSGPITIAEAAGRTASYGLGPFLEFLAVVSISLGVLNLLPIPILDGGHLLYFFIEWVKGRPLSESAQVQGQKLGIAILAALMTLAFYVDLSRQLG